ncbi:HAMP domain-containing protein [Paenibacillus sp. E222]|uniref:HAMP domain-containing sensor histidine kinase n=1 Tax=Paenibacillus sp. E222 TaxID=2748863 RepID=UPI0015C6068A|nr:HAMP domain-containing sensor histidine kinase [Paenibacillus sp. E222]QLG36873.1 HAMP domain-containing protein [Paenibacillus sp. E222]
MIKTLYVRIIFTFLVVIIFSLLSSFLIGIFLFKKEVNHLGQNDMIAAGEEMIRLYEQTHPEDREAFIKSMVKISTYLIHLYDVSGNVTYYDLDNTDTVQIAPEVVQMVLQGQVYRSPAEVDQTFIGLPFPFQGEPQAVFMQFSPQNENIINRMVFLILLLALFIGSLCIFIAARYLVRPIQVLTRATKQLAKGDFDVEIQTKRVDEMGALTHSFNEMASELKQLEQMRQDFVSNVSHEIQTPLTSISGFAMAMKNSSLVAEADRNYYLDIIITESGRLSRLSDNLLELASLDSDHHPFEAATYNLDEQIRQIIVTCEPQWSTKNIQVHLELAEPIQVTADRDQLNQVWMNLLGNSIKFTPAGGHIHIRTHQVENKILITITDTGIGIAPEQLDYVFDRFYKTDLSRNRSISGNGLGLAIVKKIVMIHHGTVEIQSQEGEGTTVLVHLPLA